MHRGPRGIQIPTQKQKQEQKQKQKQTVVSDREHRDGCTRNGGRVWGTSHDERIMTAISKARARARQEQHSNSTFCELTDAKWEIGAELLNAQKGCARMIERADALSGPCCACTQPWWSLRHSGMVKMQLIRLGNVELYRPESAGRRACCVLCPVLLPRLTRESCMEKVQLAREEECSNSDMFSTMTRSCTLYIPAQLPSVHRPDQV